MNATYKYLITFFLLLVLGVFFSSFKKEEQKLTVMDLVRQSVKEQTDEYRKELEKKCQKSILARANEIVDSTLKARAKLLKADTIGKPPKPLKPEKPEIIVPEDTIIVEPLLSDQDSINQPEK